MDTPWAYGHVAAHRWSSHSLGGQGMDGAGSAEIRQWTVTLEIRTAANDVSEACLRLALRHPYHGTGDTPVLYTAGPVTPYPSVLTVDERCHLELDYPRGVLPHLHDRGPRGPFERAHVADYVQSLQLAHQRAVDPVDPSVERRFAIRRRLRQEVRLEVWRMRYRVRFLAGRDGASARARASELAATVVDYAGRPLAKVAGLRLVPATPPPDPAIARALVADHETGQSGDRTDLLARSACDLWCAFLGRRGPGE